MFHLLDCWTNCEDDEIKRPQKMSLKTQVDKKMCMLINSPIASLTVKLFVFTDYLTVMHSLSIRAWPDINSIDQKWKRLQDPLFELLCTERVVYTPAHGGNWLNVEDVIFNRVQEDDPKELLVRVFLSADQNVGSLPDHVLKALELYTSLGTEITPSLARKVLKETPSCYKSISRSEKLLLLKFVLKDDMFSELLGLELLPISNGQFASFSNVGEAIYICSPEHPRELLPCLQDRFLDQSIDENLLRSLRAVADQGTKQVEPI